MVGDGRVEVLKGIDFEVKKGEFIIIFGPSGCGKSTLLHCLLGLEAPSEGKVYMEDKNFYEMTEDQRAIFRRHKVGMIYQQPLWISSLKVFENLCFPLHLLGLPDKEIEERAYKALEKVGMSKWAHYVPLELSSGQQQKISLARALMIDPVLIVADEPTGNLDTTSGRDLLDTFMLLVKQGKTIIMVTHDLEYLKYATKILHMIDGELVEEYSPKNKGKKRIVKSKKEISEYKEETNVHDRSLLKKLNL